MILRIRGDDITIEILEWIPDENKCKDFAKDDS